MKIKMNDLMDLWGEDQPAEPIDAEKLTREVLKKAEKDARPRKKRRIILIAAVAAIVAVMGGTAVAASAGKLHFEKTDGYKMPYSYVDGEKDTVVETDMVVDPYDAIIRYENEETEKDQASTEESHTVAMKLGYLPHELTVYNSLRTLASLPNGDSTQLPPGMDANELYIEVNDSYGGFAMKEAERAAELVGKLTDEAGYDEAAKKKAAEVILDYREAMDAGIGTTESDKAFEERMTPYVDAVMALPGLVDRMRGRVFEAISAAEEHIYSVHVFARPEAEGKPFLVPGKDAELVWEKEINGMDAMMVRTQETALQITESLLLYDVNKGCVVMISGTIGEEEMLKIAENMELVETDLPAQESWLPDWIYVTAALG
ncbi:MAG: DUF4367 domain-containing protein [Clostridia bacterium]|nr:DUF4367 domain-containing protein [Clostridia bacterium]